MASSRQHLFNDMAEHKPIKKKEKKIRTIPGLVSHPQQRCETEQDQQSQERHII